MYLQIKIILKHFNLYCNRYRIRIYCEYTTLNLSPISLQGSISQIGDGEVIGTAAYSTLIGCSSGGATVLFLWKLLPVWGGNWSLGKRV